MTDVEHHYRPTCLPPMVRSRFPHRATCSCSWVAPRGSSSGGLAMAAWETHRDEERHKATRSHRIAQAPIRRVGASWVRYDDDGPVHAAHGDDRSPVHTTYPTGYDERCGWCWLGYAHTDDGHAERVATARAQIKQAIAEAES